RRLTQVAPAGLAGERPADADFEVSPMTVPIAALLLGTITASPIPPAPPRNRAPIASQAVASALEPKRRDIEIIVVGDVEDGAPGGTNVVELGRVAYWPGTPTARAEGR